MDDTIYKIDHWAKTFNLPIKHKSDDITQDRKDLSMNLITEEYKELLAAYEEDSQVDVADALGDLIWVCIRKARECGIPIKAVIDKIYKANMSKLDSSEEAAKHSVEVYKEKGVEASYRKIDGNKYQIYRVEDNKVLKASVFKAPEEDLSKLLNPNSVILKYRPINNDFEFLTVETSEDLISAFYYMSKRSEKLHTTMYIQHKEMKRLKELMKEANIKGDGTMYKMKASPFSVRLIEVNECHF